MAEKRFLPKIKMHESSSTEARPPARKSPRNRLNRTATSFRHEEGLPAGFGGRLVMIGGAEAGTGGEFGSSAWFTIYFRKLRAKGLDVKCQVSANKKSA